MSYTKAMVDAAERRIREACPTAHIERMDYRWGLTVMAPDRTAIFSMFRPARNHVWDDDVAVDYHQDELSMDNAAIDRVIEYLRACQPRASLATRLWNRHTRAMRWLHALGRKIVQSP